MFNDRFNKNYLMSGVNDDCNLNCVQLNFEDELVLSPQSDLTACIKGWFSTKSKFERVLLTIPGQGQS